jgi:hypothetical protein
MMTDYHRDIMNKCGENSENMLRALTFTHAVYTSMEMHNEAIVTI